MSKCAYCGKQALDCCEACFWDSRPDLEAKVNALSGIPDPVAFVAAAREVVGVNEAWLANMAAMDQCFLTDGEKARFAALRRLKEVMG